MNENKFLKGLKWFFKSYIWLFILFFIIDIVTKRIIVANLAVGDSIELIPNFLWITYVQNTNAAFGMGFKYPEVNRWLFVVVATIGTAVVLTFYIKNFKKYNQYIKACLMLILVGALGNLVDRLFYADSGYAVVDWINFFDTDFWHWVFNIADSCVVVGAIMLAVYLIVEEVKEENKKRKAEKALEQEGPILSKEEQERLQEAQNNQVEEAPKAEETPSENEEKTEE